MDGSRGRPNKPSPKSLQLIHDELSKKSQSPEGLCKGSLNQKTVYSVLGWLLKNGLVSKTKHGDLSSPNKKIYFIPFETSNMNLVGNLVANEWRKLLHVQTRKEQREAKQQEEKYVESVLAGEILPDDQVPIVIQSTKNVYFTFDNPTSEEVTKLFLKAKNETICPQCFLKDGSENLMMSDPISKRVACKVCGVESTEDIFETEHKNKLGARDPAEETWEKQRR